MNSTVVSIEKILKVSDDIFTKQQIVIPLYQRPYTWDNSRIVGLLRDIFDNSKFIGILILDECNSHYEIIDGQQRITTCMLLLSVLHNKLTSKPTAQRLIRNILFSDNQLGIKNDSICQYEKRDDGNWNLCDGKNDYLTFDGEKIVLNIPQDSDIYNQAQKFIDTMSTIDEELDRYSTDQNTLSLLRNKITECTVLVITKTVTDSVSQSAEQIFLDINEKAQKLVPADIFKGHCFKNYDPSEYHHLKEQWAQLLRCANEFKGFLVKDLSKYIYLFLLSLWNIEESSLSQDLTINGTHILAGKDVDSTCNMLDCMIEYGENILKFRNNLKNTGYCFEDLCFDAEPHRMEIHRINIMKQLVSEIISSSSSANYQKLPFLGFVYLVMRNDGALKSSISYNDLRILISDFYIYSMLFTINIEKRSKSSIDTSTQKVLQSESYSISALKDTTKALRRKQQDKDFLPSRCGKDFQKQAYFYSVIDFYDPQNRIFNNKYYTNDSESHNQEHLIVPDNNTVVWKLSDLPQRNPNGSPKIDPRTGAPKVKRQEIRLTKLSTEVANTYKQELINYIIIPEVLNGTLESFDIVHKILKIEAWYNADGRCMPRHVEIIIEEIKSMQEYIALEQLKSAHEASTPDLRSPDTKAQIEDLYNNFLLSYFSEEHRHQLHERLRQEYLRRLPIGTPALAQVN